MELSPDIEELRKLIVSRIYVKTGIKAYKPGFLTDLLLINFGYYEIQLRINFYKGLYITISIGDNFNHILKEFDFLVETYNDIDDMIDYIFRFIKPARLI